MISAGNHSLEASLGHMMIRELRIVKEGLLQKRGEHIKNWRPRYFCLFDNGDFKGFRQKPEAGKYNDCLNDFTVKGCQVLSTDRPRPFTFMLRGLHQRAAIERTFCAENEQERTEWCRAIESVANAIASNGSDDIEMLDLKDEEDISKRLHISNRSSESHGRKISLDDFEFIKVLGKGTFGKVILCREKKTGLLYAIKVLKKEMIIAQDEVAHTLTENRVLRNTNHPFLVSLKYSFQTNQRLCFVIEYVNGGELFFHLSKERVFSEERTRFYTAEILLALQYLHSQGIIYRDLKIKGETRNLGQNFQRFCF